MAAALRRGHTAGCCVMAAAASGLAHCGYMLCSSRINFILSLNPTDAQIKGSIKLRILGLSAELS